MKIGDRVGKTTEVRVGVRAGRVCVEFPQPASMWLMGPTQAYQLGEAICACALESGAIVEKKGEKSRIILPME